MQRLRFLAALLGAVSISQSDFAQDLFHYSNPITEGIDPHGVRDCQVFRDGADWYMVPTSWPHWPRQETNGASNPGVVLYRSADLVRWQRDGVLVAPPTSPTAWYRERFWAPEVHRIHGRYYVTFNCSNPEHGYPGQHFGYAVADSLHGPYHVVTADKPLGDGNDLSLFEDTDGKVWAFWNRGREFGIGFAEVDLDRGRLITPPQTAIRPGEIEYARGSDGQPLREEGYDGRAVPKVARCHEWDSIGIEGAYVIKREGTYYLFYSSWTRGYEIGCARATSITGPWVKSPRNPFYGEQSAAACQKNGIEYRGDDSSPFNQVGHNEVFTGPDGRLWLSCHGILKARPDQPMLVIDPLDFENDGWPARRAPSATPQTVTLKTP